MSKKLERPAVGYSAFTINKSDCLPARRNCARLGKTRVGLANQTARKQGGNLAPGLTTICNEVQHG